MLAALTLAPADPRYHYNYALLFARGGHLNAAEAHYRRALSLNRDHLRSLNNLAQVLLQQKRLGEAVLLYRQSLDRDPTQAHGQCNIGLAYLGLNDLVRAEQHFAAALALDPYYGLAHHNMGLLRDRMGRGDEARLWHRGAVNARNPPVGAYFSLGVAFQQDGRADRAIEYYRKVLDDMPNNIDARSNLANALLEEGEVDSALSEIEAVLSRNPRDPNMRWSWSWVKLLQGDLDRGFSNYDVRWTAPDQSPRQREFAAPLWNGNPVSDGKLLLWGESGVGDEVLCAGMIGEVIAAGNDVVVETDRRFVQLFHRSFPSATVIRRNTPPEPLARHSSIKAQSSTLRLPRLLRKRWDDFPKHHGYLRADVGLVDHYRARFGEFGAGRKVGFAWSSFNPRTGVRKSTRLADWEPVLATPNVQFISLQYGVSDEVALSMRQSGFDNFWPNPNSDIRNDLDGLAAQITALDCVVTIGGINAHLCGALGKPGLVLIQHTPLWFWFDHGDECPWYPSLRLFRQLDRDSWREPIARIAATLRTLT